MIAKSIQQAKAAYQKGDWTEAERLCRIILKEKSDDLDALNLLGVIAAQTRRPQEAVTLLSQAIAADPNHAISHSNLGNLLLGMGRPEDAMKSFDRALEINPHDADTLYNRGSILGGMGRYAEALASCDEGLAIKPDFTEALNVRGSALGCLKRPMEALESFGRAIALKPDYAEAFNNRGVVLGSLQRRQEALEDFEAALKIKPDNVEARWNIAPYHLQLGDFKRGWAEYEYRWLTVDRNSINRDFPQQLWLGNAPLEGKTILLHSEQGYGDTLHFCRYAKLVAALGARVILEVQPALLPLLANLEGTHQVIRKDGTLPHFDYHCPLLSLPMAFKTELDTIPADVPYVFSDATRVALWRDRLGKKTRPRVGLVWSGSPAQANDHNRSMPLAQLLPLLHEGVEWISLQQAVRASDAGLLAQRTDIRQFGDQLKDFADTAALVESLDIVLTVCTSVAHLAGAMGKPTWVLLCFNADWRWLLERTDSPWYPTARLFRQTSIGDWTTVIKNVRKELTKQDLIQRGLVQKM